MPIETVMEKLSPQLRIFALVAALVAVGGGLFVFMAGRGAAADSDLAALPPVASVAKQTKAPGAHKAPVAKAKAPAAKPKVSKTKAPVKIAPKKVTPRIPPTGFPLAVDRALAKHRVVVVSLVVPGSHVDELAAGEAKAGAKLGGAGYLALNVLNERVAQAVLTKLNGVKEPSLLVLKRSGEIVVALEGFVDRQTVAQAAANAAP
jgi:hypothetical protein